MARRGASGTRASAPGDLGSEGAVELDPLRSARSAIGPTTLTQAIVSALTHEILSGSLEAGSWLRPLELAERFGTSPTPVREAIRSLVAEGMVVALPQRGYRVSPVSREDLEDIYRIRLVLDPMAMELGVPRLDEGQIERSARALDALVAAYTRRDPEAHRAAHRAFHFSFYESCGSPWLLRILRQLWDNSERYQRLSIEVRGGPADRAKEHRAILEAAEAKDAKLAATLTREHLSRTVQAVGRVFGSASASMSSDFANDLGPGSLDSNSGSYEQRLDGKASPPRSRRAKRPSSRDGALSRSHQAPSRGRQAR